MTLAAVFEFLQQHKFKTLRIDSRQVQPGDVFLAFRGKVSDGRDFIAQAVANGAAAVLYELGCDDDELVSSWSSCTEIQSLSSRSSCTEIQSLSSRPMSVPTGTRSSSRDLIETSVKSLGIANLRAHLADIAAFYYQHPSHKLKVIGVTGTNGKTSITHYIAQLLHSQALACGIMGTLGNGVWPDLIASELTTSDCCMIQDQLAAFVNTAPFVAMEVSSGGLDQGRLDNTRIDTAVFTNLSQDHLDYHQTMEAYFAAKCKLFTEFAPQHCVINLDDEYSERLLQLIPERSQVITYSITNPAADVYYQSGIVRTPWGNGEFKTNLIGKFNTSNALAALTCCALQGLPLQLLLQAMQTLTAVTGRMQLIATNNTAEPRVIVDYAHTPDALVKVLQALQEYKEQKIFCIVGCGGDRDRSKRPKMLRAALDSSDVVIITQDNPRTEDPQQIVNDMLAGINPAAQYTIELDRAKAIQQTIAMADVHDLILIAGKGHEDYQIIGTNKRPFSDQLIAKQALEARR